MMHPFVRALRPAQWAKNLLVFAGVVFGGRLADAAAVGAAAAAFVVFSAAASAVYLANDLRDAAEDRRHPRKRLRPIAAGEVPPTLAGGAAAVLAAAAVGAAAALGRDFLAVLGAYLALHLLYVGWARGVAVLDVVVVALGFVLRAVGGAVVVAVPYSPWLLVTTFLGALLLVLGKRRAEAAAGGARPALVAFPVAALDAALSATAGALLIAYALYTILSPTAVGGHAEAAGRMVWTFPFVAFGVLRYLVISTGERGVEEPEGLLFRDRPMQAALLGWFAAVVAILYGGR